MSNLQDKAVAELVVLRSLQNRVGDWHRQRFPAAEMEYVALKTCEEVGELASAVLGLVGTNSAIGKGDVAGEAADVVICIMVLLDRWYPVSLFGAVEAKLAILNDLNSGHRSAFDATLSNSTTNDAGIRLKENNGHL